MKRVPIILLVIIALATACDKMPQNGDLDGMWQVMEIRYNPHGEGYDSVVNKKTEQIYWAFQLDLMSIRAKTPLQNELSDDCKARFSHRDNRLDVYEIYYTEWNVMDTLVTDESTTAYCRYGIRGNRASFAVEQLTSERMQLRSDYALITFRKF